MAYLLEETLKFPKDSFKSMKYQPYELKPSFSMYRVYEWHRHWYGNVYVSFSGGLDSTVLAYIVCLAYRKYKLDGTIPLVFSDTGTEFPEIRKFVHVYTEWLQKQFPDLDIRLEVIRPKHSFKWVMENKGFPITSKDTAGKIRKLRHGQLGEQGKDATLEDGVVMLRSRATGAALDREYKAMKKDLKAAGYNGSLGIRGVRREAEA